MSTVLAESMRRIHKPYKQRPKKCVMKIAGDPSADTQDNNIARWVVDQQFREAMEQLDIPKGYCYFFLLVFINKLSDVRWLIKHAN